MKLFEIYSASNKNLTLLTLDEKNQLNDMVSKIKPSIELTPSKNAIYTLPGWNGNLKSKTGVIEAAAFLIASKIKNSILTRLVSTNWEIMDPDTVSNELSKYGGDVDSLLSDLEIHITLMLHQRFKDLPERPILGDVI